MNHEEQTMTPAEQSWPVGGGEMGRLIRTTDWSDTPLGALDEWPQQLRSAVDICLRSPSAMAVFWGQDLTLLPNDAWQQLFEKKILGESAGNVLADHEQTLRTVHTTGRPAELKKQHLTGAVAAKSVFDLSLSPLPDQDHTTAGVLAIATESSPEVKSENARANETENGQFREMIDVLPTAIYMTDAEGRLTHYNAAAVEFSGREPQLGSDQWCISWKLYRPDGTPLAHEACPMAVALKEGRSIHGEEVIAERPDGKRIQFEVYPSPLYDEQGNMIGGINMLIDVSERKKTKQALRRSKEHLKMFLESTDTGIWDLNLEDGTAWRSLKHDQIFGYQTLLPEWSYDKFLQHVLPEDREFVDRKFNDALDDNGKWDFECRIRRADGATRWIGARGKVFSKDETKPARMLGIVQDTTERKKSQEAIRESERKYQTLFESIDEGFCIVEVIFDEDDNPVDYRFLETNPAFERQTGMKDAEGKRMYQIAPDLEKHWVQVYGKVALTGEPARFEDSAHALNRWFNVYAFRFGRPEEKKVAVLFKDVSERIKFQQERERLLKEVKNEREKLADIFQHAPSFMAITSGPDHTIERANDLYRKLIGNRDLIGKPAKDAIPEAEEQGFIDLLDQVYKTGEAYIGTDVPITLQQDPNAGGPGKTHYLDFVYQPLRNSDGSITGIFVQGVDLTERKRAKDELKAINATLEERVEERTAALLSYQEQLRSLASQLSKAEENERQRLATELHDNLGQILTMCKMKIDLLKMGNLDERTAAGADELAELMDEAIKATRELMSDLKPPPALDKENLEEAMRWVARKMEKHGLEVTIEDDGVPKPLEEEVRTTLLQSVKELLFNVVKHAEVNEACIKITRQDNQIEVAVEDKGQGFDPQGKEPVPTDDGGFGLFNISERMDLLGGGLNVNSIPGQGTSAVLYAPIQDQQVNSETEEQKVNSETAPFTPAKQNGSARKVTVLLADDHQMVRTGLRKIIEEEQDLTVIAEASDGREAVQLAREASPDVVVMDVNMPGMNGIEATRRITDHNPDVRVIGLSLHDKANVAEAMQNAGASAYLTKGEVYETLCATIRSEALVTNK